LKYLGPLFKKYPQFGICLIHAHCKLEPGEKMVSTGRISEPKIINEEPCFPERWLSSGDQFEFSSSPTIKEGSVPMELLEGFQSRLKSFGPNDLSDLLGLCYVHDADSDSSDADSDDLTKKNDDIVWLERTEGRTNILEPMPKEKVSNAIPATWYISCDENMDDPNFKSNVVVSVKCRCYDPH